MLVLLVFSEIAPNVEVIFEVFVGEEVNSVSSCSAILFFSIYF